MIRPHIRQIVLNKIILRNLKYSQYLFGNSYHKSSHAFAIMNCKFNHSFLFESAFFIHWMYLLHWKS